MHALAIMLGSLLAPALIGRLGLVRTLYGCILGTILVLLLLPAFPNVHAWFPIRFALGAVVSVIFIAGETWIIHVAPRETRGRIVGIFGFVWSACFAAGPLIIRLTGIEGWTPFLVAAVIVLLAALPLPLAQDGAPGMAPAGRLDLWRLFRVGPATLLAVFLGVALGIEAISPTRWSLLLAYPLGLMGVLTFYSSGQSVIYYASGYVSRRDFWVLGFFMGTMFVGVYLLLTPRWLAFLGY